MSDGQRVDGGSDGLRAIDGRDRTTQVAIRSIELIANGGRDEFDNVIAPHALNHESAIEPPQCRTGGPDGFHATALWLRAAFSDLSYRVGHVVTDKDLVVVDITMSGRHTGPFVLYNSAGKVATVWAPTGKTFAVRQSHWFRVVDGRVAEHWAVRDDLGQGEQLGWVPPTPAYLIRCARAKRQAIREHAR